MLLYYFIPLIKKNCTSPRFIVELSTLFVNFWVAMLEIGLFCQSESTNILMLGSPVFDHCYSFMNIYSFLSIFDNHLNVIFAKLAHFLLQKFDILCQQKKNMTLWGSSTTILHWIHKSTFMWKWLTGAFGSSQWNIESCGARFLAPRPRNAS